MRKFTFIKEDKTANVTGCSLKHESVHACCAPPSFRQRQLLRCIFILAKLSLYLRLGLSVIRMDQLIFRMFYVQMDRFIRDPYDILLVKIPVL